MKITYTVLAVNLDTEFLSVEYVLKQGHVVTQVEIQTAGQKLIKEFPSKNQANLLSEIDQKLTDQELITLFKLFDIQSINELIKICSMTKKLA